MHTMLPVLRKIYKNATKNELVKIWNKGTNRAEFYRVTWLLNHFDTVIKRFDQSDLYISFNTFKNKGKNTKATRSNLFNCYAFCIDIDYKLGKDKNVSVEKAICCLRELYYVGLDSKIPVPYFIEYGNQFRLIYLLDGYVSGAKQIKALELVQKKIVDIINAYPYFDFHAETQGLQSYIRIADSFNTKNMQCPIFTGYHWDVESKDMIADFKTLARIKYLNENVISEDGYILNISKRKTLSEYMNFVLGDWEKPTWYDSWKNKPQKKKKTCNLKELNLSRMKDIEKIQQYIMQSRGEIGYRNWLCFTYFIHALPYSNNNENEAIYLVNAFNANFSVPLSDTQVKNCISSALKKNYKIKTATLLNKLHITEKEAAQLNLFMVQKTHKKTRKKTKKKDLLEIQRKAIIKHKNNGKTNKQIAAILHISEKKTERLVTELLKSKRLLSYKKRLKITTIINSKNEKTLIIPAVNHSNEYLTTEETKEIKELKKYDFLCRTQNFIPLDIHLE